MRVGPRFQHAPNEQRGPERRTAHPRNRHRRFDGQARPVRRPSVIEHPGEERAVALPARHGDDAVPDRRGRQRVTRRIERQSGHPPPAAPAVARDGASNPRPTSRRGTRAVLDPQQLHTAVRCVQRPDVGQVRQAGVLHELRRTPRPTAVRRPRGEQPVRDRIRFRVEHRPGERHHEPGIGGVDECRAFGERRTDRDERLPPPPAVVRHDEHANGIPVPQMPRHRHRERRLSATESDVGVGAVPLDLRPGEDLFRLAPARRAVACMPHIRHPEHRFHARVRRRAPEQVQRPVRRGDRPRGQHPPRVRRHADQTHVPARHRHDAGQGVKGDARSGRQRRGIGEHRRRAPDPRGRSKERDPSPEGHRKGRLHVDRTAVGRR